MSNQKIMEAYFTRIGTRTGLCRIVVTAALFSALGMCCVVYALARIVFALASTPGNSEWDHASEFEIGKKREDAIFNRVPGPLWEDSQANPDS